MGLFNPGQSQTDSSTTGMASAKERYRAAQESNRVMRWFFCDFTSIGGLAQARSTDLHLSRVIWTVLFFAGVALTAVNTAKVVSDYMSNPEITKTRLDTSLDLGFPALTFCNRNLVHCGRLRAAIHECMANETCADATANSLCQIFIFGECGKAIAQAEAFSTSEESRTDISATANACAGRDGVLSESEVDLRAAQGDLEELFLKTYTTLGRDIRRDIAHRAQDMFKLCDINLSSEASSCKDLLEGKVIMDSPLAGVCYSFNFNKTVLSSDQKYEQETSSFSGPTTGAHFVLDLQTNFYLGNGLAQEEGMQLVVHDPNASPLTVTSGGFGLIANTKTKVALSKEVYWRQPAPYPSNCTDKWPVMVQDQILQGSKYQTRLCHMICADIALNANCGCVLSFEVGTTKWIRCTSIKQRTCLANHIHASPNMSDCSCRPECNETAYHGSMTATRWPSVSYISTVARRLGILYKGTVLNPQSYDELVEAGDDESLEDINRHIRGNILKLEVFYESKMVLRIHEFPKYSVFSFLSALGGAIGLYLGVSLIAIFEVFEIATHLCAAGWRSRTDAQ